MSEQLKLVLTSRQQAWAAVKGMLFPAIGAAMRSGRRGIVADVAEPERFRRAAEWALRQHEEDARA